METKAGKDGNSRYKQKTAKLVHINTADKGMSLLTLHGIGGKIILIKWKRFTTFTPKVL